MQIIISIRRGSNFRTAFARLGEVRSLIPSHVNIMALTATITANTFGVIVNALGMLHPHRVIMSPVRRNLMFAVVPNQTLVLLAKRLRKQLEAMTMNFPKTVVFCRR